MKLHPHLLNSSACSMQHTNTFILNVVFKEYHS